MSTIPVLISIMLPLVAQFALPIASGLSVFTTIGEHKVTDELLVISFLRRGRSALRTAVAIFIMMVTLVYGLLVFHLGPYSYLRGKKFLFDAAKEHILQLEPGRFHSPFPDVTFYFSAKEKATLFKKLVVMLTSKEHEQFLFCARSGNMINDMIVLHEGTLCTAKDGHFYLASFHETTIDLGSLVDKNSKKEGLASVKYATVKKLLSMRLSDQESFVEFHKRVALVVWLIVLVILSFLSALFLARATWLTGLLLSSLMFICSYMGVAMGTVTTANALGAFLSFYLPPILLLIMGYIFFKKK